MSLVACSFYLVACSAPSSKRATYACNCCATFSTSGPASVRADSSSPGSSSKRDHVAPAPGKVTSACARTLWYARKRCQLLDREAAGGWRQSLAMTTAVRFTLPGITFSHHRLIFGGGGLLAGASSGARAPNERDVRIEAASCHGQTCHGK